MWRRSNVVADMETHVHLLLYIFNGVSVITVSVVLDNALVLNMQQTISLINEDQALRI